MEPGNEATILPIICASFLILICVLVLNSHRFVINYFFFDCVIETSIINPKMSNLVLGIRFDFSA